MSDDKKSKQRRRKAPAFRHIEFLSLSEKRVLLIIVTPEGGVQNRILTTERDYEHSELVEAANYINAHFAGLDFGICGCHCRAPGGAFGFGCWGSAQAPFPVDGP